MNLVTGNVKTLSSANGFICLKQVSKSYLEGETRRAVLRDTSLCIAKKQFVAVLGKSGAGKTTLLNLISGIDRVDSGEISINGLSLTALTDHESTLFRRKNIGFIFQFFNLIPTLTVWENVVMPLELNGLYNETGREVAESLLREVGLFDRKRTYPDRLSGGEQQRVSIARALVHDPMLVLADEPTGNLDEETGDAIMVLLNRMTRQRGKNLILVTHSAEAARVADQVYELHEGRLTLRKGNWA